MSTSVIHEVGFDDAGNTENVTINPIVPAGTDLKDLKNQLRWMLEAIRKPLVELPEEIRNEPVQAFAYQIYGLKGDDEKAT